MSEVKGWKVFDKSLRCRGFQYEVGQTYHHDGEIRLCGSGFHFHTSGSDLFNYYPFTPSNRVCEVIAGGNIVDGDDKSVTDTLTIVRELTWHEVLDICNNGDYNSGNRNSGDYNSGDCNSGDYNSGRRNSGDCNSGDFNSGHCNSGDYNSGHRNSGDCNSGDFNSGHCNSGDFNSGHYNSGHCNSGDYNSCYRSSGFFCTEPPPIRMFNREIYVSRNEINFPRWCNITLTQWIDDRLVTYGYKEAWRRAWDKASDADRREIMDLPNWDNDIFFEITGIDVHKELGIKESSDV